MGKGMATKENIRNHRKVTKRMVAKALVATNGSPTKASRMLGLSEKAGRIYQIIRNDDELAELVKQERYKFYESLPVAANAIKELVTDWSDKEKRAEMSEIEQKQGHQSATDMLRSANMLPNTGHPTYIQNVMMNFQPGSGISPVLNELFAKHFAGLKVQPEENVTEAEFEEVTTDGSNI